jgi:hypothetical protein
LSARGGMRWETHLSASLVFFGHRPRAVERRSAECERPASSVK